MKLRHFSIFCVLMVLLFSCGNPLQQPSDENAGILNSRWIVASGPPSDSLGSDGDLYLDSSTTMVYVKTDGTWTPITTLRGSDGTGWLIGSGAPASSLGNNGDLYLDTSSTIAYEKVNGVWVVLFTLQGAPGNAGQPGQNGATWLTGEGAPGGSVGKVGDLYLDILSGEIYKKVGEADWDYQARLHIAMPDYVFTPSGVGTDINGVAFGEIPDGSAFVGVGLNGAVIISTDGTNWSWAGGTTELYSIASNHGDIARGIVNYQGEGTGIPSDLYGVAYGNDTWVAVGTNYSPDEETFYSIYISSDAVDWTWVETPQGYQLFGVTYADDTFVAVGCDYNSGSGIIMYSADYGVEWYTSTIECHDALCDVTYGDGLFMAVGYGYVFTSMDGQTWDEITPNELFAGPDCLSVAYGNGRFVAAGWDYYNSALLIMVGSLEGETWTWSTQDLPIYGAVNGVAFGNGGFVMSVVVSESALDVLTSTSGLSWNVQNWGYNPDYPSFARVGFGNLNGGLFAVARGVLPFFWGGE
jgi:hypothetical protein